MTPNGVGTPYNLFINSQLKVQLNFPQQVPHALKGQKHFVKVQLHIHNFLDGYMAQSVCSLDDTDAMAGSRQALA